MARQSSIRTRLVALLLVPSAGIVAVAGLQLAESVAVVRQTADIRSLAEVAQAERDLLHSLQIERTRSLEYVAELAGDVPTGATRELQDARDAVERARADLDATLAELDLAAIAPEVLATDQTAQAALAALQPLRFNLDAGRALGPNVIRAFDDPIAALLQVDQTVIALIDQPRVRDALQGSLAISQIKDGAIRSGDVVLLSASGAIDAVQATRLLTEAGADTQTWLAVARTYLPAEEVARVEEALVGLPTTTDALGQLGEGAAGVMADVTEASADALRELEIAATGRAVASADAARDAALREATILATVSAAVLLFGGLLLVLLLRSVVSPLRQLTAVADRVRSTLPDTVERVAGGEEAGASAFDDPTARSLTRRGDELGDLARAIRASTDEATRVAADQATTRAGVTRTIEDVARREQSLVERQLSLLDALEDAEQDPDQLAQLFRLDHLATRMRRNAENLLLLSSGRLPGGQDAVAVPLVDVVRTAAAEIEQYARVDVRVPVDERVVGYASTPLSHLLAEVIENATQFSPPTSRVTVGARAAAEGVVVTVTDQGIGMGQAEIADARRKLAAPPLLEAAESRRLGLYVVGLIATRIGVSLDLRAGEAGGITVEVLVPQRLFLQPDADAPRPAPARPALARSATATPHARSGPRVPALRLAAVPDVVAETDPAGGDLPVPVPAEAPPTSRTNGYNGHVAARLQAPDAMSEMQHLLDATPAAPPALPDDVVPATAEGLPSRSADLPRRSAAETTAPMGLSLSAASGGRTVDLNPQEVGRLMASLSGIDHPAEQAAADEPAVQPEKITPTRPQPPVFDAPLPAWGPPPDAPQPGHPAPDQSAQPDPQQNGMASSWSTPYPPQGA